MDDAATSHLPAGSNTAQLTGNKLPRPLKILKEHSAASANQKAVLGCLTRARAAGHELQLPCVAPLILLQPLRLFLHLELLNPGLDGC